MKKLKLAFTVIGAILLVGMVVTVLCLVFIPSKKQGLSIRLNDLSLLQNTSQQIEVECSNKDAEITFDIYDESIATISNNVVYAHKAGVTTLRAKATYGEESKIATASIRVLEDKKGPLVELPKEITLFLIDKDKDRALEEGYASEMPFALLRECSVSVTGDAVKVSKNVIVAKKVGSSIVNFVGDDGQTTYAVTVNVERINPVAHLSEEDIVMEPLETRVLNISISPTYFTGEAKLTYECSSNIISVEDGVLTALSSGKATVKVFLNDELVGSINVSVVARAQFVLSSVSNCKIEGNVIKVKSGKTARLIVEVKVADEQTSVTDWTIEGPDGVKSRINYLEILVTEPCSFTLRSDKLGIEQEFHVEIVESLD